MRHNPINGQTPDRIDRSDLWISPQWDPSLPIDTIIFDVDGVLWDTADSFDETVQQTVAHILASEFGVADPRPVTKEELRTFRRAGGLNNDWDMSYTLIATRLAGRDDIAASAAESAGRGRAWARSILPDEVAIDFERLRRIFDEIYWGADSFPEMFGEAPRFVTDAPGCWHQERQLLPADLLDKLQAAGIRHFGIATGRNRQELATVMATLQESGLDRRIPPEGIVTGDVLAKPDGRVLQLALSGLADQAENDGRPAPQSALFCGDTRDDLQAVLNYRALAGEHAAAGRMGAVAVVPPEEFTFYQRVGSDATIRHVSQLPTLLAAVNGA